MSCIFVRPETFQTTLVLSVGCLQDLTLRNFIQHSVIRLLIVKFSVFILILTAKHTNINYTNNSYNNKYICYTTVNYNAATIWFTNFSMATIIEGFINKFFFHTVCYFGCLHENETQL